MEKVIYKSIPHLTLSWNLMIIFSAWLEILRIFALNQPYTEITDGANDSTNDTDIDNDTELIIELPSCVNTVKGG